MALPNVLASALRFLLPGLPGWVGELAADLLESIAWLVGDLEENKELEGKDKLAHAIESGGEFADMAFDDVPGWSGLSEEARDRILGGLVEAVLFLARAKEGEGSASGQGAYRRRKGRARKRLLESKPKKAKAAKAKQAKAPEEG